MMSIKMPVEIKLPKNWAEIVAEKLKESGDYVHVVRCKDCKIAFDNPFIADFPQLVCRKWENWHVVEPNDFCSYGERKEYE